MASIDATCFRLAELDDLGEPVLTVGQRALDWLASRQRLDGAGEEDATLEASAPPWADPVTPRPEFYLTVNATSGWPLARAPFRSPAPRGAR